MDEDIEKRSSSSYLHKKKQKQNTPRAHSAVCFTANYDQKPKTLDGNGNLLFNLI